MLGSESVGAEISMAEVVAVENTTKANNNNNELLGGNGDTNENIQIENEDEKGGGSGNGDDVGCAIEKGSSDVKEKTKKGGHIEVAVEESSAAERENNEESSTLPPEAKVAVFQQEVQPVQYQQMSLNQPVRYQQVPVRQPIPYQQAQLSQSTQHQNLPISQATQQYQLPLSHPAQYQQLPLRQPVQYQQLPLNLPVEHQQPLRQVLHEASCQAQHQMPQSIHSEPEIRPEPLLGKRVSPPNGGHLGHDAPEHLSQEVLDAAAAMALAAPVYDSFDPTKVGTLPMKSVVDYAPMQPMKPTQHLQYVGGQYHNQYASQGYGQPHGEAREAAVPVHALPQENILQLCHNCQKEGITTYKLPRRWCSQCRTRKRAKNN